MPTEASCVFYAPSGKVLSSNPLIFIISCVKPLNLSPSEHHVSIVCTTFDASHLHHLQGRCRGNYYTNLPTIPIFLRNHFPSSAYALCRLSPQRYEMNLYSCIGAPRQSDLLDQPSLITYLLSNLQNRWPPSGPWPCWDV